MHYGFDVALVIVIGLGVFAQWAAWRIKIPAIVLLTLTGLAAGPWLGIINPEEDFGDKLEPIISLCVAIILFEGGLNLAFHELKASAKGVRRLVYLGVPLSWMLGAWATHFIGGVSWEVSMVFGAIIVVTGPTVIIPMLRHAMLNKRTASYLKWEGIINDPIGVLLAVLVFEYFIYSGEEAAANEVVVNLLKALLTGILFGGGVGFLCGKAFRKGLVPEYLKMPVTLGLVLLTFLASDTVQAEAGLLTVTIMGIVMGNMGLPSIEDMRRFKEYLTILLVSMVFILLSANLEPEALKNLSWRSVALIAAIMLLVRPIAVMLATLGAGMDFRDRLLISWIAPRGIVAAAVTGLFATRMVEAGYTDGELMVPLIFSLIFATVIIHGFTLGPISRWLGLASTKRNRVLIVGCSPWTTELALTLKGAGADVLLVDTSWHRLRPARLAGLPVYYGEILSDDAEESLELNDVGILFAATSNDAYNSLVCYSFAVELDRAKTYQLPMYSADDDDPKGITRSMRGRIAFDEDALFETFWQSMSRGWKFQKTGITDQYDYLTFQKECPEGTIEMFVVKEGGEVAVNSPQHPVEPEEGDTVIYFAPPREESSPRKQAVNE